MLTLTVEKDDPMINKFIFANGNDNLLLGYTNSFNPVTKNSITGIDIWYEDRNESNVDNRPNLNIYNQIASIPTLNNSVKMDMIITQFLARIQMPGGVLDSLRDHSSHAREIKDFCDAIYLTKYNLNKEDKDGTNG